MPKRTDIESILIIGSGPIVIGQACEFDYSGTQACRALREEGYRVVLINSNPATIMTDPDMADRTYIEPITAEYVEKIIRRERPDVLLPTLGGQTALNVAVELAESGVLDRCGVELIGAKLEAIKMAEDRELFQEAMGRIGLEVPRGGFARTVDEAWALVKDTGFPAIIRPAFTLGGAGGSIAHSESEYAEAVEWGLSTSPITEVLIEESVIGWKEYELEVMRDLADNVVIICSIENFDPMGVHTGDSITVAPAQTLTDKEYQALRDASIKVIREIGVETGGSNIQFAVSPEDGRILAIEMNPRVSRSSALASKATGFPIAKIAAKLAVGYTLDEIPNDITRETPASFEPTIDYVVVKIPRWAFEKFPNADTRLGTQMKSVGETMAIGRTFKEAIQKGLRGLEIDRHGLGADGKDEVDAASMASGQADGMLNDLREEMRRPHGGAHLPDQDRPPARHARRRDLRVDRDRSVVSPQPAGHRRTRGRNRRAPERVHAPRPDAQGQAGRVLRRADRPPDRRRRTVGPATRRLEARVDAVFKTVDTCAAEFEAMTPYYYSTYETENETRPKTRKTIMILGGGPNRIGQGIEFDYCCVQAVMALKEDGFETIMVNSNPETVSTDYDISDRLFFEPLTFEDVMNIIETEKPDGVIVQFGGQTPLKLALPLERAGVPIIGTSPDSIDLAEDRKRFGALTKALGIPHPPHGTVFSFEEARAVASEIGYPVLVRPSYVLGGRNMALVYDDDSLQNYMRTAVHVSPEHPILIDMFLEDAFEYDVDAISDGADVVVAGMMEHIEEAGIHSGDSACVLPPYMVKPMHIDTMRTYTHALARSLEVVGLINAQYAIKNDVVYVLEVNPRASRTIPFVSKAIGVPLAQLAARVMAGKTLREIGFTEEIIPPYASVKEVVLPFVKFAGSDSLLGPEMKSTGEVMGIYDEPGIAFAKGQSAAGGSLPLSGTVLVSVNAFDHENVVDIARELDGLGFTVMATSGTGRTLEDAGLEVVTGKQGLGGRTAHRGPHPPERHPVDHQYTAGQKRAGRRLHDPPRRHRAEHPVHHHALGGLVRGQGHPRTKERGQRDLGEKPAGMARHVERSEGLTMQTVDGGVLAPQGYLANTASCGINSPKGSRKDLVLIDAGGAASAAGVFTTNRVQAAPVILSREHLQTGMARAVVANSGNANACNGEPGMADAREMASLAGGGLSVPASEILVASTGVIGRPLPMDLVRDGIREALDRRRLGPDADAAESIMTTDTVPKSCAVRCDLDGTAAVVGGIAKGAGMICPNMATMIGLVTTDAAIAPGALQSALRRAVGKSFNCITVDGDMSTNDTVFILANGAAENPVITQPDGAAYERFAEALEHVCTDLAKKIARDGEGATKLVEIGIRGARTDEGRPDDRHERGELRAREDGHLRPRSQLGPDPLRRRLRGRRIRPGRHRPVPVRPSTDPGRPGAPPRRTGHAGSALRRRDPRRDRPQAGRRHGDGLDLRHVP